MSSFLESRNNEMKPLPVRVTVPHDWKPRTTFRPPSDEAAVCWRVDHFMTSSRGVKVKLSRYTMRNKGERKYNSFLVGMSGQRHAPAALYPQKGHPFPIGLEAGWTSELVWTEGLEGKHFVSAGDRTPVVQALFRHYAVGSTLCQGDVDS
jgi:hypothetical protein